MIKIGIYEGKEYGKDESSWTIVKHIDVNKKELFVKWNENQKINDKKLDNLTETIDSLKIKNEEMINKY